MPDYARVTVVMLRQATCKHSVVLSSSYVDSFVMISCEQKAEIASANSCNLKLFVHVSYISCLLAAVIHRCESANITCHPHSLSPQIHYMHITLFIILSTTVHYYKALTVNALQQCIIVDKIQTNYLVKQPPASTASLSSHTLSPLYRLLLPYFLNLFVQLKSIRVTYYSFYFLKCKPIARNRQR